MARPLPRVSLALLLLAAPALAGCLDKSAPPGDSTGREYTAFRDRLLSTDAEAHQLHVGFRALFNGTSSASSGETTSRAAMGRIDTLRAELAAATPRGLENFTRHYGNHLMYLKEGYGKKWVSPSSSLAACCKGALRNAEEAFTLATTELAAWRNDPANAKLITDHGPLTLLVRVPALWEASGPATAQIANTQIAATGGNARVVLKHLSGDALPASRWKVSLVPEGDDPAFCTMDLTFEQGTQIPLTATSDRGAVPACSEGPGRPDGDPLSAGMRYQVKVIETTGNTVLLDRIVTV